jgi:hypothetical protein
MGLAPRFVGAKTQCFLYSNDPAREIKPERSARQAHNIFAHRAKVSNRISGDRSVESKPEAPGQPFPERVASNSLDQPVNIGIETQVQRSLLPTVQLQGKNDFAEVLR